MSIIANNAVMGGHVSIGDHAVIGGAAAIHQFVRIGRAAMIGGVSGVEGDVIPFGSVIGNRARLAGLNIIGLKRRGFDKDADPAPARRVQGAVQHEGVFAQRLEATRARFGDDRAGGRGAGLHRRAQPSRADPVVGVAATSEAGCPSRSRGHGARQSRMALSLIRPAQRPNTHCEVDTVLGCKPEVAGSRIFRW